jgi:2,5-diketo-D-gluconate reductase A
MASQPVIALNDGSSIPQLGFGVWQVPPGDAETVVRQAVAAGYRSIDTAAAYNNEDGVGAALAGGAGQDVYLTTKLWNDRQGFDATLRAFDESMARLKRDRLDLYLIHWPAPRKDLYVETWRAMIRLRDEGRIASIGVSNFTVANLKRIIDETGVVPAVNQIELHPRFQQRTLRDYHASQSIATESWSPLGRGRMFDDPVIAAIADKHGRSPAQVVIRWHLDSGLIVIPKSVTPARIAENIDVFGFTLDKDDLDRIAKLDDPAGRAGPDPDTASF